MTGRSRAYERDQVRVYTLTDDPSDPGMTAGWVFDPAAHDPFDFVGPDPRGLLIFIASVQIAFGLGLLVWATRLTRRRASVA